MWGKWDASTSHQPPPTGFILGMYCGTSIISATPLEDTSITHEEDVEVPQELEETGNDASSDKSDDVSPQEPSPKKVVTKLDTQSVSQIDPRS